MTQDSQVNLSIDEVYDLAFACLSRNGCDGPNAEAVAETVTAAERDLCHSHGLFRIPAYVASLRSGKVDGTARPEIEALTPAIIRVDGRGGFAPLPLKEARGPLAAAAREQGIAALALVDIYHWAALWAEVEPLGEDGLVAFAFGSTGAFVAPAGGSEPLFGTNPMAFAWPRSGRSPMVFDQASAAMARGEIMIAARDGHSVPDGAGIDPDGRPTNDPDAILKGAQLAFGGYKGSAIAMMMELLAGPLVGEWLSFEASANDNRDGGPTRGGELMIALDPERFGDAGKWADHAENLFGKVLEQPGTRLPSDRRYENRKKTPSEGTTVPQSLHDKIKELTETL